MIRFGDDSGSDQGLTDARVAQLMELQQREEREGWVGASDSDSSSDDSEGNALAGGPRVSSRAVRLGIDFEADGTAEYQIASCLQALALLHRS